MSQQLPNQQPDRTFVRDGIFHRSLSNVRNSVFTDARNKEAKDKGQPLEPDLFEHMREEDEYHIGEDDLENIAFFDGLPGCYNFRYLMRRLARELKRSKRYNRPTTVVIVGIDGFENVEPNYGELAGDTVVFSVIQFLLDGIRSDVDMAARLSDDRYILVLPETPGRGAAILCDRLRKKFETLELKHNWHRIPVTLSFGIGYYPVHGEDPREIIARADLACEFVQQRGGNGFAFAPEG
jgi:diguanylate cyclase (GGDEF)-like protein